MCQMERRETFGSDPFLDVDQEAWVAATEEAIRNIEQRCAEGTFLSSTPPSLPSSDISRRGTWDSQKFSKRFQPRSDSCVDPQNVHHLHPSRKSASGSLDALDDVVSKPSYVTFKPDCPDNVADDGTSRVFDSKLDDIKYIDDSARSSLSTSFTEYGLSSPVCTAIPEVPVHLPPPPPQAAFQYQWPLEDDLPPDHWTQEGTQCSEQFLQLKVSDQETALMSSFPSESSKMGERAGLADPSAETDLFPYHSNIDMDSQSIYSLQMDKDFRYYFQHPYARLFISYFVIFCNFLSFAEDPVSHSHTESEIPVVGNVFSFVVTKYPPEWGWCFLKVSLWLIAILVGSICGKYIFHHFILRRMCRLKMFRDEQGTWMIMFLTSIMFIYMVSLVYNAFLLSGHPQAEFYRINALMGITNANFMKAAACGTWLGDFVTAWMVTDMMLQDNLYSSWARPFRRFWRAHGRIRIIIFWTGSIVMTTLVVSLIVSDKITWDYLNRDFVATNELSRAFLASFILVMDLLIVMQDWDFPHFVCDLDIKLPGMHAASFKFSLFQKYVSIPDVYFHITGKWFNYSIILIVMILDLNMWKNQIFYVPKDYGQYTNPDNKVHTVSNQQVLITGNETLWTYEVRANLINPKTNWSYTEDDILMNSRYLGYPMSVKGMAFVPSLVGFAMFGILTFIYGRFPPKTDLTAGGRLKKRKRDIPRSSWRRERGNRRAHYVISTRKMEQKKNKKGVGQLADLVVAWDEHMGTSTACEKPM